ncbi:short chain dehydrogenase [Stagonosporopsis vannaccii]|nr:short chain dehydrogenase [Stagonosporopsis vannaccii]
MASLTKEIVLITGANSGIGYELARQLLSLGTYHVLLTARSHTRGTQALQTLQSLSLPGSISFLPLDLTSDTDISSATSHIASTYGRLDVLVNNAAIAAFTSATREQFRDAFDANATGPYLLSKSLIGLLRKSANPRIVNVSSGAGSIGRRLAVESPMYKIQAEAYRASKVALNMLSSCLWVEFGLGFGADPREEEEGGNEKGDVEGQKGVKVFVYDPGFTVSNLSEANKEENGARSAEESVRSLVDVVLGKRDGDVGRFIHNTGGYPW